MAAAYILHQCEEFTVVKCIPADAIPTVDNNIIIIDVS